MARLAAPIRVVEHVDTVSVYSVERNDDRFRLSGADFSVTLMSHLQGTGITTTTKSLST
jgi:hypothetical protein